MRKAVIDDVVEERVIDDLGVLAAAAKLGRDVSRDVGR